MGSGVAVIIPTLDEEGSIASTIAAAFSAAADEVIVSDGGSTDRTIPIAVGAGATVVQAERLRGAQLNAGARETRSPVLLFLHADTLLPADACLAVARAVRDGAVFGGFHIAFIEPAWRLRTAAAMINLRCRLTREPWGDQGQFVSREAFDRSGGFREWPIMEDYEFARRMKASGQTAVLGLAVRTSGRRFLRRGVVRTALTNWRVIAAYERGVPVETLAAMYRR